MIVILHQRTCQASAESARNDLMVAFGGNVEVKQLEAETALGWPGLGNEWDDLLIVVFDASPFPATGSEFIQRYLEGRGDAAMILPVAVDSTNQKPPKPTEGIKSLLYESSAGGVLGRLANRVGGMLGLRVQGRNTRIFISYRGIDGTAIAEQLNSYLQSLGLHTFLDQAKEFDGEPTILPGNPVQKEIDDALATANLVLLLDTPKAIESPWIRHEIDTADGLLLPVLPICFRDESDLKRGTRFRSLLALQRWEQLKMPPLSTSPLTAADLNRIAMAAETYLCEIFRRRCRVPSLVKREFESHGYGWTVLDEKLRMFLSSRTGGRIATKVLSHCSIFDQIYEPAIKRFQEYLTAIGHANHSLFIYDGELLPDREVQDFAKGYPDFVVILHHQELATLINSHFMMLGAT
jgi:hypothetical protein